MKIRTVLFIWCLLLLSLFAVFIFVFSLQTQAEHFENYAVSKIGHFELIFSNLKQNEVNMLSATLQVVLQDGEFKRIYLNGDRDALYAYGQALFTNLRDNHGITNFLFILPDGNNFVRLHSREKYDDEITRFTFFNSRDSQELASGFELGKTAFALRVVSPYYNESELIGYVELGEGIDHFLEILKGNSTDEFAIVVNKSFLDADKWAQTREIAGLRNNWDDLPSRVIISNTVSNDAAAISYCFNSESVELIESEKYKPQHFDVNDSAFSCGGFTLVDAGNREVGTMLVLLDMRDSKRIVDDEHSRLLLFFVGLFFVVSVIVFILSRIISNPISRLSEDVDEITKGNFNVKLQKTGVTELDALTNSIDRGLASMKLAVLRSGLTNADLGLKVEAKTEIESEPVSAGNSKRKKAVSPKKIKKERKKKKAKKIE